VTKDEAVQSAQVQFLNSGTLINGTLTIKIDCTLAIGPLQLVLNVTALTVSAVYSY
jgi:hypothetical protein